MTTEDDFQRAIDVQPGDWQTRLVFADWLQDRGDPRADGYRAIAVQQRRPLQNTHHKRDARGWCNKAAVSFKLAQNAIPPDWFDLLPAGEGSKIFWPLLIETGGNKSRRECEDALALVFAQLPAHRQAALLSGLQSEDEPDDEDESDEE